MQIKRLYVSYVTSKWTAFLCTLNNFNEPYKTCGLCDKATNMTVQRRGQRIMSSVTQSTAPAPTLILGACSSPLSFVWRVKEQNMTTGYSHWYTDTVPATQIVTATICIHFMYVVSHLDSVTCWLYIWYYIVICIGN